MRLNQDLQLPETSPSVAPGNEMAWCHTSRTTRQQQLQMPQEAVGPVAQSGRSACQTNGVGQSQVVSPSHQTARAVD